jgi:hypothetical protein
MVDFLSRPKSAENENPEVVNRDDEIPFGKERGLPERTRQGNLQGSVDLGPFRKVDEVRCYVEVVRRGGSKMS